MKKHLGLLAALALGLCPALSPAAEVLVVLGGEIHPAAGDVLKNGMIVVENGKIVSVGPRTPIPPGAKVLDASGCVLLPGFVAVALAGDPGGAKDFLSLTPDASALDMGSDADLRRACLSGGITSLYVHPGTSKFLPGRGAIVKLGGDGVRVSVVRPEASLAVNFTSQAMRAPLVDIFPAPIGPDNPPVPSRRQFPASSLEAYWGLRELLLAAPFGGELAAATTSVSASLRRAVERKLPFVVGYGSPAEAERMIELARNLDVPLILLARNGTSELADTLKAAGVSLIAPFCVEPPAPLPDAGPGGPGMPLDPEDISVMIRKGLRVALCTLREKDLPDLFRLTQYLQKHGLSSEELLRAITIEPASMLGAGDRIGCLRQGRDADILVFRKGGPGPFLRLKKVLIEGEIVYEE